MVASLGGFLGRKCAGETGTQTLWLELQRLDDITQMWKIPVSVLAPHLFHPPPVSSINIGKDKFLGGNFAYYLNNFQLFNDAIIFFKIKDLKFEV